MINKNDKFVFVCRMEKVYALFGLNGQNMNIIMMPTN